MHSAIRLLFLTTLTFAVHSVSEAQCSTAITGLNVIISVPSNTVSFNWTPDPMAASYLVLGGRLGDPLHSINISSPSLALNGNAYFQFDETYRWRVLATCGDGTISPPSAIHFFTTPDD